MKTVNFLIVFIAVMIFSFVAEAGNARRPNYASDQTQIVGDNAVSVEVDTSGNLHVKSTNVTQDSTGATYVNLRKTLTSVTAISGDFVTTPKAIVPAGATGKKARVYSIRIQSAAAEVFTVTELSGFTTIPTAAGVPSVWDFGKTGLLQTTAATEITLVSADTSSAQCVTEYSYE